MIKMSDHAVSSINWQIEETHSMQIHHAIDADGVIIGSVIGSEGDWNIRWDDGIVSDLHLEHRGVAKHMLALAHKRGSYHA